MGQAPTHPNEAIHSIQTMEQTVTGTGTYTGTDSGAGATLSSGTGTIGYTDTESSDALSGAFTQSQTGTDRYGLLEHFNNVSNTGSGNTPGNMNFSPVGEPFEDPFDWGVLWQGVGEATVGGVEIGVGAAMWLAPSGGPIPGALAVGHGITRFGAGVQQVITNERVETPTVTLSREVGIAMGFTPYQGAAVGTGTDNGLTALSTFGTSAINAANDAALCKRLQTQLRSA